MATPFEAPRQREEIVHKYGGYYRLLARVARYVVMAKDASNEEKYALLKKVMPSVWNDIAAHGPPGEKTWPQFVARAEEYNADPATWAESGAVHNATVRDRDDVLTAMIAAAAKRYFPADAELILDLGCGWGHRMFDMWRAGIAPTALYMGGDRSAHSRDLVQDIRTLFPAMKAGWFQFDFLEPDFGEIPGQPRRLGLFTCHAVEQVNVLGNALFDWALDRFPDAEITGIHFEPTTFQFGKDYPAPSYADVERDRAYAEERGYNMDLYAQVKGHPDLSVIAVEQAILDLGVGNSTSLLVWRRERP